MVDKKDFDMLIDIIELVMGVVVNCDDKQVYIGQILECNEKTQEDLKKLIERSLQRVQMDFADPSVAGYTETPSSIIGL